MKYAKSQPTDTGITWPAANAQDVREYFNPALKLAREAAEAQALADAEAKHPHPPTPEEPPV